MIVMVTSFLCDIAQAHSWELKAPSVYLALPGVILAITADFCRCQQCKFEALPSRESDRAFCRTGIQLVLNSKVSSVDKNSLQVDTNGKVSTIPFGACVWSTGVAMHPLIRQLQVGQLPCCLALGHCSDCRLMIDRDVKLGS